MNNAHVYGTTIKEKDKTVKNSQFKVGYHLRTLKYKNISSKGYTPN